MVNRREMFAYLDGVVDGMKEVEKDGAYTRKEVIDMLKRIRRRAWKHHSKFGDDVDYEVDKAIEDVVDFIDEQINELRG